MADKPNDTTDKMTDEAHRPGEADTPQQAHDETPAEVRALREGKLPHPAKP